MEFFPSLLTQGEGGVSILGCHWTEWDSNAAWLEISAAGCCVCQRPVSCSRSLQTHCHLSPFRFWMALTLPFSFASTQSFIFLSPSLSSSPLLHVWNIPAVIHDPVQSDRLLWFDASPWRGLSRREGQTGMGEGTGRGKEEGSQTHRDGEQKM